MQSENGMIEPEIRAHLKTKLKISAMKTSKTHLERLELTGMLKKETMAGKSNIWKVNTMSERLVPFFIEIISKKNKSEVIQFYNSSGVQQYLTFFDWTPHLLKLFQKITHRSQIENLNPEIYESWIPPLVHGVYYSPTTFLAIMAPNINYTLLAAIIAENWPSKDEVFGCIPEDNERDEIPLFIKDHCKIEISVNAYSITGLLIDYHIFPENRDKITSHLYHLSLKYPYYKGDRILSNILTTLDQFETTFDIMSERDLYGVRFSI